MASNPQSMLDNDRCIVGSVNRLLWRSLKLCVFLAIYSVLAEQSVADQAEPITDDNRAQVLIILQAVQEELLGPNPKTGISDWSMLPYVGGVIDSAIAYSRSTGGSTEFIRDWREMSGTFDFHGAVMSGITELDRNANWQIAAIEEVREKLSGLTKRIAHRMMRIGGYDYVFIVNFLYYITPGLDQVRSRVSLLVYARDHRLQLFKRNYEYLSQSRGYLFRPFLAGEKEAMIEAIENQYKLKVEQFPKNRNAYRKDRKDALNALKGRDVILPIMAFNEGWPGDSFSIGLQLATDNILAMMNADLHEIRAAPLENQEMVTFNGFDLKGHPEIFEGYVVGGQGLNTIYRGTDGNMYSVP